MHKITRDTLHFEYVENQMTDSQIAEKYGRTRPAISKMRKRLGIKTREFTGYNGELLAIDKLMSEGFKVENMNEKSMTYPFDLLVNDHIRIDVKTATLSGGYYNYILSDKEDKGNIVSENRIQLSNGRMKKLYNNTCDYILCVAIDEETEENQYFLIPTNVLPEKLQTLGIPSSLRSKYAVYKDRWDFLLELM